MGALKLKALESDEEESNSDFEGTKKKRIRVLLIPISLKTTIFTKLEEKFDREWIEFMRTHKDDYDLLDFGLMFEHCSNVLRRFDPDNEILLPDKTRREKLEDQKKTNFITSILSIEKICLGRNFL